MTSIVVSPAEVREIIELLAFFFTKSVGLRIQQGKVIAMRQVLIRLGFPTQVRRASLSSMILGAVLLSTGLPRPVAAQQRAEAEAALGRLRSRVPALSVTTSARTGLATFVSVPGNGVEIDLRARSASERALNVVTNYGQAFGLRGRESVAIRRIERDALGIEHVRLAQTRSGIPVAGGDLIVHLRGSRLVGMNGKTLADEALDAVDLVPTISAEGATNVALARVRRSRQNAEVHALAPRLEIFNGTHLGKRGDFPSRLAWFVEVRGESVREFVWVDAQTGVVHLSFSQLTDAKDRKIYDANSQDQRGIPVGTSAAATLIRSEGQTAAGNALLADALNAYNFSGDTYDYFLTRHNRDSFDNAGGTIHSTIRHCPAGAPCPYENAFWDGQQMVYGEGYASGDDVVAHEITHAVIEHSANLFYYMQSGALNESYADIFGETIDLNNNSVVPESSGVRWQMGEELVSGGIRNMMDPTFGNNPNGDPGKMTDSQFRCDDDPVVQDAGGVHSNSGVPNHAFALMVDGGAYNGFTIAGIGLEKAGRIQYRALTTYLTSAGDFLDNYNAIKTACSDLVGLHGITSADCTEVGKALDAVQMSSTWTCSAAPLTDQTQPASAPVCSAGSYPVDTFFDGFEAGLGNWTISGMAGTWSLTSAEWGSNAYNTGGVDSLWGYNQGIAAGESFITRSGFTTVPANAFLHFNHSYGFDDVGGSYWDGGRAEYSTDGTNWLPLSSLHSAGANFNGTIAGGSNLNPMSGLSAFVGDSYGYTSSRFNLSTLAGQNVKFRFRIGTDDFIDDYGWFIDDFRLYTCVPGAAEMTTPTPGSTFAGSSVSFDWSNGVSATEYWLEVGSTLNGKDLFNASTGTNSFHTVTGIPTDGRTIYVRLWTLIGGVWLSNSYTYTAANIPPVIATMTSPANGSTLSGSSVTFEWNTGAGINEYWLSIGSTPGGSDIFSASKGLSLSHNAIGLPTDGRTLYVVLWSRAGASTWLSNTYTYTAFESRATITSPTPGSTLAGSTVTFQWSAGSAATEYWLSIGNSPNGAEFYNASKGTSLSHNATGLPTDGRTLHLRLWTLSGGVWLSKAFTFTAANLPPVKASMTSPTNGSTLASNAETFTWDTGTSINEYWLSIGSTPGGTDLFNASKGLNTSHNATGLPIDGRTLHVVLWSRAGSTWFSNSYTYTALEARALMTSPTPGSMLAGSSATFQWTPGTGVAEYWLSVGSTPGGHDVLSTSTALSTSYPASGLPTDARTLYVTLWSRFGASTWLSKSYTYQAFDPRAEMTSPTPGSELAGSGITFAWSAGTGVSEYWLSIGNSGPGSTQLYNASQGANLSVMLTMPIDGKTLYFRLWSKVGTAWLYRDYVYQAAGSQAALITPVPGSTLGGASVSFTWDAGIGNDEYYLQVGTTIGGYNLYNASEGTNLSRTVNNLPTDGSTIYVRLWSRAGTVWADRSFVFKTGS